MQKKILNTCPVLHNMCIEKNIPIPDLQNIDYALNFGIPGDNAKDK